MIQVETSAGEWVEITREKQMIQRENWDQMNRLPAYPMITYFLILQRAWQDGVTDAATGGVLYKRCS